MSCSTICQTILGNEEISGKSQTFIQLWLSAQTVFLPKRKSFQYYQKANEKQKLNFSCSALFYMKTRVCLKYFVLDCKFSNF